MLTVIVLIVIILLIIYVISSLASIKYELNLIKDHLNISEESDLEKISDEEIEELLNQDD